jgi:hypothetical protein
MANQHISELSCDPDSENEFAISSEWIIDTYIPNEWNGIAGNLVKFYSDTPGSKATIDLTTIGNVSLRYVNITDIAFIGGIVKVDSTCVVSNSSGIIYSTSSDTILNTNLFGSASQIVKQIRNGSQYYPIYIDTATNELRISNQGISNSSYQQICTSATIQ